LRACLLSLEDKKVNRKVAQNLEIKGTGDSLKLCENPNADHCIKIHGANAADYMSISDFLKEKRIAPRVKDVQYANHRVTIHVTTGMHMEDLIIQELTSKQGGTWRWKQVQR